MTPTPKRKDSLNSKLNDAVNTIGHYTQEALPEGYMILAAFKAEGYNVRLFKPDGGELGFNNTSDETNVFALACKSAWAHNDRAKP